MAYVFDPINNTLIDDEDKSLGNKFALLDSNLEAAIQSLNEKFGPGTVQQGTQGIPQPPIKTPQAIFEFEERMKGRMADGGKVRQNFFAGAAAIPFAPALSYPVSFGLATLFGLSTAGGAKVLGDRVTNHIKDNPEILNDPRFKAAALAFGISVPGYIAPDADEMEREKKRIEDLEKERLKGTPPPKIETKEEFPADDKPLPVIESFPAELEKLPFKEEFPIETQQLPIIFENRKAATNDLKKDFDDKAWKDTVVITGSPVKGTRKSVGQKTNVPFFEKLEKYSKDYHGGNLKSAIKEIGGIQTKPGVRDKELESLYTTITNAAKRSDFTFDAAGKTLTSNIPKINNPIDLNVLTNTLKRDPNSIDSRIKELKLDKNKIYNRLELQDILGLDTTNTRKNNFFFEILKDQGLKPVSLPGGKQGFKINDVVKIIKDYSTNKLTNYEARSTSENLRKSSKEKLKYRLQTDEGLVKFMYELNKNMRKNLTPFEDERAYIPNSTAEAGHNPVPVNFIENVKFLKNKDIQKKLFSIQNMTWQFSEVNRDLLRDTQGGLLTHLQTLDKYFGKTKTEKNAAEIDKAAEGIVKYFDSLPGKLKNIKDELYDSDFVEENTFGKLVFNNPEIGQKITSDNFSIDMSDVDPRFIMGNVDLINPDAIKYNDLSKEEKIQFGQRVLDQKIEQLTSFYKSAGFDEDIINEITEALQFGSYRSEKASAPTIGIAEKKGVGFKSGGGVNITPLPRTNFSNGGGATGADDNFLKELEYYFTNEDAELPPLQTFEETKNPIEVINDIIDPRNYPYYADVLVRSGLRVGEFGVRILPALGKLINDLITKPAFKYKPRSESSYDKDQVGFFDRVPIKGTGIFSEFLENITPTETEKFFGLDKLIEKEEQRLKNQGYTSGPKVFADTIGLGAEVTAPIFPGLKIAEKALKPKKVISALENRKKSDVDSDAPAIPKPSGKFEGLSSIENVERNIEILKATKGEDVFDPVTNVTRDLVKRILIKKGIEIGDNDPIDVYMEIYGDVIIDVKNLAEEILEARDTGRNLKSADELLKIEGFFDMPIPKDPYKGVPVEDTINMLEKDLREKKMLEGFTTKDKTKNAKGGIIK